MAAVPGVACSGTIAGTCRCGGHLALATIGNIYDTIRVQVLQYLDPNGRNPFARWFDGLDPQAAAKVTIAVARLEQGNLSNTKGVGAGVLEYRIDFGPGYRVYFGRDGTRSSFSSVEARRSVSVKT